MDLTDASYQDLEAILEKECEAHERLLSAATQVNTALKETNLETLQRHTVQVDTHITQIEQLEERRQDCCNTISRALGLGRGSTKLEKLIEKAPPRFQANLAAFQKSLKNALQKIVNVNVSNRVLLEEGLEVIRTQFQVMMQPNNKYAQYRHQGTRSASNLPFHPFVNQTV